MWRACPPSPLMPPGRPALTACTFNQDFSCIASGTLTGYSIASCEPFKHIFRQSA